MDSTALISGFIAAQVGRLQLAAAGKMLQMNANTPVGPMVDAASVVKLVNAAGDNIQQFANAAAGLGTHVDITV
jgi:hypothetical protein